MVGSTRNYFKCIKATAWSPRAQIWYLGAAWSCRGWQLERATGPQNAALFGRFLEAFLGLFFEARFGLHISGYIAF